MSRLRLVTRAVRPDDAERVAALAEACARARSGRPSSETAQSVLHLLRDPDRDPAHDVFLTELDGALVAAGSIWAQEPYTEIWYEGSLDPAAPLEVRREAMRSQLRRGIEGALHHVDGLDLGHEPRFGAGLVAGEDDLTPVLEEEGFAAAGGGIRMRIDLDDDLPRPWWPAGVTVRRAGTDLAGLEDVLGGAFLDHHGDLSFSAVQVAHILGRPEIRAEATLVADDDEGPVGAVICLDEVDGGYVDVLGVLRRGRRRGIGRALLQEAFLRLAAGGTRVVRLYVDADSLTGAVGLYESAGMYREQSDTYWDRPLRPGTA